MFVLVQYHQRLCLTSEGGAQEVSSASAYPPTQSQVSCVLPPSAGLLCGAVSGEGP